jgi:hypothetical protein
MSKKIRVKKHIRDGVTIDAHDRIVTEGEAVNLSKTVKSNTENKKKKKNISKLFFGGSKT